MTTLEYQSTETQQWLIAHGSREQIIDWLVWNDRNGIYTDADSALEGLPPLSRESAASIMQQQVSED